jgi:hypothetical protein
LEQNYCYDEAVGGIGGAWRVPAQGSHAALEVQFGFPQRRMASPTEKSLLVAMIDRDRWKGFERSLLHRLAATGKNDWLKSLPVHSCTVCIPNINGFILNFEKESDKRGGRRSKSWD